MPKRKPVYFFSLVYLLLVFTGLDSCHCVDREDEYEQKKRTATANAAWKMTMTAIYATTPTPSATPTSPPTETPSPTPRPTLPGGLPALPGGVMEITYEGEVAYTGDFGDKPPPPPGMFLRTFKIEDITGETYRQYLLKAQQNEWKEIEQQDSLLDSPPPENIEQTYYQKDEQIVSLTYDAEAQILEANVWPSLFTITPQSDWGKFSQSKIPQPQAGQVGRISATTAGEKIVAGRVVIMQISPFHVQAWLQSLQEQGWQNDPAAKNRFQSQTARSFGPSYQPPEEVFQEIGEEWRKSQYARSLHEEFLRDTEGKALAQFAYDGMTAIFTWLIP
jgi:hypothetical protein